MVADELRFTQMFRLVDFGLRRSRGCTHVMEPDLDAFVKPVRAAVVAATEMSPPPQQAGTATTLAPASGQAAATRARAPSAASSEAPPSQPVVPVTSAASLSTTPTSSPPLPQPSSQTQEGSGKGSSASSICNCGSLGLPELAAEKLSMMLLLLLPRDILEVVGASVWEGVAQRQAGAGSAGDAGGINMPTRLCGKARCRKCRQRAAATGDRAAGLELLREQWRRLLRLEPLGLFSSVPVLMNDLEFLRMQLGWGCGAGSER